MLSINELSVTYRETGQAAVRQVSLTARSGERIALIGPNGAGKSTLLLAMLGILPLEAGSVTINNITLSTKTLTAVRCSMGLLFQNPDDQLFMPTVREDVMFGPFNQGIPEAEAEHKADEAMERVGIIHLKNRAAQYLSGGEKRLAALAGLLAMEPPVLLMDEPTAFLDPRASRLLASLLRELPQTMLIATHDLAFARSVCERVVLIHEGKLRYDGDSGVLEDEIFLVENGL